jgi:hypothetical protein
VRLEEKLVKRATLNRLVREARTRFYLDNDLELDTRLDDEQKAERDAYEADAEAEYTRGIVPDVRFATVVIHPETLGGQVMLEANADADTRQRVKAFDDKVTKPHLSRYYDWMMTRSEKDEIKGDYEVDARGSSALVEKDVRNQAAIGLAAVTSNPQFASLVKPLQALKAILRAMRQDPEEIVKTDDELAAEAEAAKQNPPPADPRIEAARIAAESKAKSDQNMREIKSAELEHDAQKEQGEFEIAQTTSAVKRDVELSRILAEQQNEQAARESAERLQNLEIANERDLFNAEASLRVNTGEGI